MAGRAVYSYAFPLTIVSSAVSRFDVPAGFIGVVRDMRFSLPAPVAGPYSPACLVTLDTSDDVVWQINGLNILPGVYSWLGHQVFSSYLEWTHFAFTCNLRASGYLLSLP